MRHFVDIDWGARRVRIEHQWLGRRRKARPLLVFLHEGLGSRSLWRDFPAALCSAGNYRGLVYSRPGYGSSTPRSAHERWGIDFLHRQALEVLPALRQALGIAEPCWLFGHSDGASIALLHAAHHPAAVAGAVLLAPHVFVEPISVQSIRQARQAYADTNLRERMARHHDDVDSAFWGWNDIWLHPDFLAWNIEVELASIRCPLLAIQGLDDEYGTLEQIHRVQRAVPATQLLELAQCAHSPHRDQPDQVIAASVAFIDAASARTA